VQVYLDAAALDFDNEEPETLAFALREGPTLNLFLRRGPVAAHLVATSGPAPRVLVAFPAGNTGCQMGAG